MTKVVIGLNYGDEGKGSVVDYLTRRERMPQTKAVVRFNGGAQAGHTAINKKGERHVFHQIGSGAFNAANTILSKYHIFNPTIFRKEYASLKKDMGISTVYLDPEAMVTTPFDIMINQVLEESRGKDINGKGLHGSCGMGINETVERNQQGFSFNASKLDMIHSMKHRLDKIFGEYVPDRLKQLGILDFESDIKTFVMDNAKEVCDKFIEDSMEIFNNNQIRYATFEKASNRFYNLVFEGAQGLLLDQDSDDFPHVTRSSTGLKNVEELLKDKELNIDNLHVYYVTRCYLTRHGAGPLKDEIFDPLGIVDETNIPNDYQHHLRFAPLDFDKMAKAVDKEREYFSNTEFKTTVVVNCCDHFDKVKKYYPNNMDLEAVVSSIKHSVMADEVIMSHDARFREC